MLAAIVLAAGLIVPPALRDDPRPFLMERGPLAPHRFLQFDLGIIVAGVRGTETVLTDRVSGRFVERIRAGILSSSDGFDGTRAWDTDATGMPSIEDHADDAIDSRAWAHFSGRTGPERPAISALPDLAGRHRYRLRYPGLSGPIDVTLERRSRRLRAIDDWSGIDSGHVRYFDYRTVDGLSIPFGIETASRYGSIRELVRTVRFLRNVPAAAFAPPPPPNDASLSEITSLPMDLSTGAPVVPIRIDGGPVLHVLFDTGSTNFLRPSAVKRLGLRMAGSFRTGGVGPNTVTQRYTMAPLVTIGAARLRMQPFSVIEDPGYPMLDGTIGCEVLQRFAVRFDFARRRVDLARNVGAFHIAARAIPMQLNGCTPDVAGALDGMRGRVSVDTGSGSAFDVMGPFVRAHDLVERYQATEEYSDLELGGMFRSRFAAAKSIEVGTAAFHNVPIGLTMVDTGAFTDPTEIGNAGVALLNRYVVVFDYRSRRMWLL